MCCGPCQSRLDVSEEFAKSVEAGQQQSRTARSRRRHAGSAARRRSLAARPQAEAKAVFNSTSKAHPGRGLHDQQGKSMVCGRTLEGTQPPSHYDFRSLRLTPAELRAEFARLGWRRIVAFQTRNPMHRAHQELTFRAAKTGGSQPPDSSRRGHDQAGRRGLFHPRPLLPVAVVQISCRER